MCAKTKQKQFCESKWSTAITKNAKQKKSTVQALAGEIIWRYDKLYEEQLSRFNLCACVSVCFASNGRRLRESNDMMPPNTVELI